MAEFQENTTQRKPLAVSIHKQSKEYYSLLVLVKYYPGFKLYKESSLKSLQLFSQNEFVYEQMYQKKKDWFLYKK